VGGRSPPPPQHRDLSWKEQVYHPTELAADALEEINRVIECAVTYARKYGPKRCVGNVVPVDPIERWVVIQNRKDRRMIPLSMIIGAEAEDGDSPPKNGQNKTEPYDGARCFFISSPCLR
jgi:hypothetical protein